MTDHTYGAEYGIDNGGALDTYTHTYGGPTPRDVLRAIVAEKHNVPVSRVRLLDVRALDAPALDPQFAAQGYTRGNEIAHDRYMAEAENEETAREINGVGGPCEACGEYSVLEGTACTLGYPGHPGAEYSATYTCINPDCQHTELAG